MEAVEELRYLILGAQREGARVFAELLKPLGLTAAQAEVLAVLRDADEPLTVREIGERLVCESGSPSRLVATVADAGLIERGTREGDRRAVELTLTPAGARAAQQVASAEQALHASLAASLTDRQVDALVSGLRKLVDQRAAGAAIAHRR
ncbi:MarR family winged helix-turn-helix transcriptional regulator [Conexibacter woesei]|uniref:MarR family winged helix-turn-helix transcriptional regulator n=1 Tax=Conexibacter woesei TaxID=191495 RepID=UPI0003F64EE5|nr:MarR family transcriptional regulator [Conexibacter woesei]